jgi:hypothetical protein
VILGLGRTVEGHQGGSQEKFQLERLWVMIRAENEFELEVKKVRSDNGSEIKNTRVDELCDHQGIKHKFSA